jgi:cytochrome c
MDRALLASSRRLGLAALLLAVPVLAQAQSAEDGKVVFNKCRACHQVGPGAKNLVGPELNGLMGRKAGSVAGFNYSEANKNSGLIWDQATFREYIKNPRAKIPNTKMVFPGLTDEKDINDLLAFLEQYAADGKPK